MSPIKIQMKYRRALILYSMVTSKRQIQMIKIRKNHHKNMYLTKLWTEMERYITINNDMILLLMNKLMINQLSPL